MRSPRNVMPPANPPHQGRAAPGWLAHALPSLAVLLTLLPLLPTPSAQAAGPVLPPLNDLPGQPRLPGKFVWADLVTADMAAARTFYAGLLGWTYHDLGGYSIALHQGRPLGGLLQKAPPHDKPGARPRWIGYLSVPNVKRAVKSATRAGGRVVAPPAPYPRRGEQALLADPEGAIFGVLKSSSGDPEDFLPEPGGWIWAQLLSRDARQAGEFYREVADYRVIENTTTNRVSDFVLAADGYARATIRTLPERFAQVNPNWLLFVRVQDVAASVAKARELGGRVLLEPSPERFMGRAAVIADPTGAALGLLQWNPEDHQEGAR